MWQILTIAILLALMIGLEDFNLVPLEQYLGDEPPFTPKSLAATGFIILAAFTTGELFKKFKIPALLGYIAAGIIFGPQLIQIIYEFLKDLSPQLTYQIYGDRAPRALFSNKVIDDLYLINVLTVGVIGTMGGGELKISDIKESWKVILATISMMVITAIPITIGVVMSIPYLPVELATFLNGAPTPSRLGAAILFGILAMAMSPAATLAIIQETRAKGKFTSLSLGIVVVADLVLVAFFLVGFNISKLLVAPDGFSFEKLAEALPGIGLEFGWAFVIGAATGLIFILYMRYVRKEMMLFTIGVIFAASFLSKVLHAETLLAFLTAGFIVQNFSKHGHDLIHELEKISTPVFIVYFMIQAAKLDIMGVVAYLPITLILAALRAGAYYGSTRFATKKLGMGDVHQRWLWLSFISRGGVDLVLAEMVASAVTASGEPLFAWGTDFQTVVVGTVVVHIIAGPPLLKFALGKANETEESQAEANSQGEGEATAQETLPMAEFPVPDLDSSHLNNRLMEMREHLISLHKTKIAEPLETRRGKLEESIHQIQQDVSETLTKLENLIENEERYEDFASLQRAITTLYMQSRRKLQPSILIWEKLEPLAIEPAQAMALISEIQNVEPFDSEYVVEIEEALYDPQQAQQRTVKLIRRLRSTQRFLVGTTRRNIPLGKLWRFYIELSIPRYLEKAASVSAQSHVYYWYDLGQYLHRFDEVFSIVLRELLIPAKLPELQEQDTEEQHDTEQNKEQDSTPEALGLPSAQQSNEHDEEHDNHASEEDEHSEQNHDITPLIKKLDPSLPPRQRALQFIRDAQTHHQESAESVLANLNQWLRDAMGGYSWSLQQAYSSFLHAVKHAGTLELPGVIYRPSKKFDDARLAENQLTTQLQREREAINAYVGWIVLEHQLALFTNWFGHYQKRIIDSHTSFFEEKYSRQLRTMAQRSQDALDRFRDPEDDFQPDWTEWYRKEIFPTLRSIQRALDRELTQVLQGVTSRRLIDALEYRVASFSEHLRLLKDDPYDTQPSEQRSESLSIQVRKWFSTKLVSELSLRYIEFNEQHQRIVRRNLVGLEGLQSILTEPIEALLEERPILQPEQNGSQTEASKEPGDTHDAEMKQRLLLLTETIQQLSETLNHDLVMIEGWMLEQTSKLLEQTAKPFTNHQLDVVIRSLSKNEDIPVRYQGKTPFGRIMAYPINWADRQYQRVKPLYSEFIEDLQQMLSDESATPERNQIRARLQDPRAQRRRRNLPPVYRRLFNPVPLDLPEFYVERPELEKKCLRAVCDWGYGDHNTILIKGERGIGKRTFIHNLVPIKVYDLNPVFQQTSIETISIPEDAQSEADICRAFAPLFQDNIQNLDHICQRLQDQNKRQIIIVENAIKTYWRTQEGIELCRKFMSLLNSSSDKILWIVLMDTPAVTLLNTIIDLEDYFTHTFEVEPFKEDELAEMIMNRHRVSGFDLTFDTPQPRLLQRAQHPISTSEMRRNPKKDFLKKLYQLSHGNPLQALLLWLHSSSLDEERETCIHVEPLPEHTVEYIEPMTLHKRIILAALIQHGTLDQATISNIINHSQEFVQNELQHLERFGIIERIAGSAHESYRICDMAIVDLSSQLRQRNLI